MNSVRKNARKYKMPDLVLLGNTYQPLDNEKNYITNSNRQNKKSTGIMEPFKTNGFSTKYNLEKLKDNLQDDSLNEDEETIFVRPGNDEKCMTGNPLTGMSDEMFLLNRELSIEEFEAGGSGNWEEDVLKIVELADAPAIPLIDEIPSGTNSRKSDLPNSSGDGNPSCLTGLGVHDIQRVSQVLSLFGLKEEIDYIFEGEEDGYVTLKRISGIKKNPIIKKEVPKKTCEHMTKEKNNALFDTIMDSLKAGIRIKKKIGKGFVKINSDNFPMTHHEIYAWSVTQKTEFPSAEESIQCIFKKSKQLKGLSKGLDLDNVIILG
nr:MAG: phoshoprotein P [Kokolu virus]